MSIQRVLRLAGLLLLLLAGLSTASDSPNLKKSGSRVPQPVLEPARGGQCIEDAAFMRRNHMELLKHQRDDTVRSGIRPAKTSLKACIDCHASQSTNSVVTGKTNFCINCHEFVAVKIDCFQCHASKPQATSFHRLVLPEKHAGVDRLRLQVLQMAPESRQAQP